METKTVSEISKCSLFSKADKEKLQQALEMACCYESSFGTGETVNTAESSQRHIGIILSGSARVHSADGEKNVLLRTLLQGDLFGVANLFDNDAKYISSITAGKHCRVFFIGAEAVSFLLTNDSGFMYAYISFLSGRIRFLNRKIMYYTSGSAERRLALYLISFGGERITPDLPMNALAELLDIGRASLYRAIDRLTADGYIVRENNDFIITDPCGLYQFYKITPSGS